MICTKKRAAALIFLVFLTSGCTALVKPDIAVDTEEEASVAVADLRNRNEAVPTYKGIGEISAWSPEGSWGVRGAWAAAPEGMFRVEALGLTGQPLARLICDDEACHFIFSEDGCYRMVSSSDRTLDPLIGVGVGVDDLVVLLGGGVPLHSHEFAWLESDPEGNGSVLVLAGRLGRPVEKIFFSPGRSGIYRVEVYGWRGLKYRARIGPLRSFGDHEMPTALWIERDEGAGLQITVERGWTGVPISENLFVPDLPESESCD